MKTHGLEDLLASAASEVLEETAFLFTRRMESPSDPETWPEEILVADLLLHTLLPSRIRVAVTPEIGLHLAEEILGESLGNRQEALGQVKDALGEVLNMVSGILAERLLGPGGAWELGVPRVRPMSPSEYLLQRRRAQACALLAEEDLGILEISLFYPPEIERRKP